MTTAQKCAEHHNLAAEEFETAAKHHREAARHYDTGEHTKGHEHADLAHRHASRATYHFGESAKHRPGEETQPEAKLDESRNADCHLAGNSPEKLDEKLDHALRETFPDSDPVSVKITR